MSSYHELEVTVNIQDIEEVYYNDDFRLDLEETLELMKETPIDLLDENIVFYGKNFKVILEDSDSEYSDYEQKPEFIKISLKRPFSSKIYKPFTVNRTELKYSKEYRKNIPFMEEWIKEKSN